MYASKVSSSCTSPTHMPFAGDTQLYLSFNPDNSLSEAVAVHAMEQSTRTKGVRAWMQADKLKRNENKTEVMLIGTRQQHSKVNLDTLTVLVILVLLL